MINARKKFTKNGLRNNTEAVFQKYIQIYKQIYNFTYNP